MIVRSQEVHFTSSFVSASDERESSRGIQQPHAKVEKQHERAIAAAGTIAVVIIGQR